jgi:hypothetical protein
MQFITSGGCCPNARANTFVSVDATQLQLPLPGDLLPGGGLGGIACAGRSARAIRSALAGWAAGAGDARLATTGAGFAGAVEALAGAAFEFVHGNLLGNRSLMHGTQDEAQGWVAT